MTNYRFLNLLILFCLSVLFVLAAPKSLAERAAAQLAHTAQSASSSIIEQSRSFRSAVAEGSLEQSHTDLACETKQLDSSKTVINIASAREQFYQMRERYHRTKDICDFADALQLAESALQQFNSSLVLEPSPLNHLSLSLDVVQWLEETRQQLEKETWVPTIAQERGKVAKELEENNPSSWLGKTRSQLVILSPENINQLLKNGEKAEGASEVYIRLNAARSLIRLMTNDSLRSALKLSGTPTATLSCQEPSWESVTCVDQLLNQAVDIATTAQPKAPQTPESQTAKAYALGYVGQWHEEAYKMQQNNLASKALDSVGQENSKPSDSLRCRAKVSSTITNSNESLLLAQRCTQEALKITSDNSQEETAAYQDYQWQWQLGRIHQKKGQNREAIAAYDVAVQTLSTIRTNLLSASSEEQFSFRDTVNPVYREYVSLLLDPNEDDKRKINHTDDQQKRTNLEKARDLIESLQLADLKNFLRCDVKITKNAESLANEDRSAAVIYPIILEDRLEVILSLPGEGSQRRLEHYSASLTRQELEEQKFKTFQEMFETKLKELRYSLEQPYISNRGREVSTQVYNWLIKPAEALIELAEKQKTSGLNKVQIKTLLFIPDGSLRNIPMAALYDGNEYLIQKYAIAVSPRLQLLADKPRKSHKALIAGLTEEPSEEKFSSLKYADKEVQEVKSIVGNSEVLTGKDFQEKNLEKALKSSDYNIVHLATHGEFNLQQKETFVLSEDAKIRFDELQAFFQDNNNVLDLLVLSACETASGDDRDTLGIAGMTVKTGARSAIASLWNIDDPATAKLIKTFYTELINKRQTKAEALRQAMLSLLTDKSNIYRPSQWAPYLLVGDWR